jgi:DNA polymerase-3 subunit alpha
MSALALTDNGALYGTINFYKACDKEGIKPIIGLDGYLAPRTRFDKDASLDKPRGRVVFLAKNNEGYKNLIKMVTESYVHGFYYRPRIDHDLIQELRDGLICIIPSFSGEPVLDLKNNMDEAAEASLDWYRSVFGDDCYLEITHHPEIDGHEKLQDSIRALSKKMQVPTVAAHDVYYLDQKDHLAREALLKIQHGGILETTDAAGELAPNFSFIDTERATTLFKDEPEALLRTQEIAERCTVTMTPGATWYFPDYRIESGKEPFDELKDMAYKGVPWRNLSLEDPLVRARLDYELDVIKMKGYAKYFLVVGDLLREARERKILTTIRGSVAGSLTTYVLGITNVNPLEYKLPFERFLNPERPSAPDIDMDYADNRRDEMIEYARAKYGAENVAQIGTFGTMMARAAVRDVARALGHPYGVGDRIAKLIPMGSQGFPMTITKAMEIEPDLKQLYDKDQDAREVLNLAKQIEGRVRHVGVHAAGVVIAPAPLTEFVPVQPDPKTGKLITQYEMHSVGEDGVGLLKFDFLGIKNLSILADAVKRVEKIRGIKIDIEGIPVDDEKTFAMLARGETMGLFQLNGSGMTAFLKQLRPSSIHDINAMVALYRPGPMESIPQYIERKHNASLISYLDPRLEKILDRSYGVITYQDDVMMIAIELAGYSWLDADKLRKAMGKKIPEVMEAEKDKLLKGFVEYGKLSTHVAEKLWKLIEPFAAYGFNKAHAASYGRVAYQTAYMKANYPIRFDLGSRQSKTSVRASLMQLLRSEKHTDHSPHLKIFLSE